MIKQSLTITIKKPESCAECHFSNHDSDWGWSCSGDFFESETYTKLLQKGLDVYEINPEIIELNGGTAADCRFVGGKED